MKLQALVSLLAASVWVRADGPVLEGPFFEDGSVILARCVNHTHSSMTGTAALGTAASTGSIVHHSHSKHPHANATASNAAHSQPDRSSTGMAALTTGSYPTPPTYGPPSNSSSSAKVPLSTGGVGTGTEFPSSSVASSVPYSNHTTNTRTKTYHVPIPTGGTGTGTGFPSSSVESSAPYHNVTATITHSTAGLLSTGGTATGTSFLPPSSNSSAPYLNSTTVEATSKPFLLSTGGTAITASPATLSNGAHSQPYPSSANSSSIAFHTSPPSYGPTSSSNLTSTADQSEAATLHSTIALPAISTPLSTGTGPAISATSDGSAHTHSAPYTNSSSTVEATISASQTLSPPSPGPPPTYGAPLPSSSSEYTTSLSTSTYSATSKHSRTSTKQHSSSARHTTAIHSKPTEHHTTPITTASNGAHSHSASASATESNAARSQSARSDSTTRKTSAAATSEHRPPIGTGSFTTSTIAAKTSDSGYGPPTYGRPPHGVTWLQSGPTKPTAGSELPYHTPDDGKFNVGTGPWSGLKSWVKRRAEKSIENAWLPSVRGIF